VAEDVEEGDGHEGLDGELGEVEGEFGAALVTVQYERGTAAGDDGGAVRAIDSFSRKVQAKRVVPRLLRNRFEERAGWQHGWLQVPEGRQLSVPCSSRVVVAGIEEVGTPDRNVPRSGGETVHGKPLPRDLRDVEVVAAR